MVLCIWQMVVMVHRSTGRWDLGWLAGALFASIPMVGLLASWSYAEAPFWLMTVCAVGCLFRWRTQATPMLLVLAGCFAAAAAHTKNEGVLLAVLLLVWVIFAAQKRRGLSSLLFLAPLFIIYGPWLVWMRYVLEFGSHATAGLGVSYDALSWAMSRGRTALQAIAGMWMDIRQWNIVLWIILPVSLVLLARGPMTVRRDILLPWCMLLAYLAIVLLHQADVFWQVGTAWNRLTVQVLPIFMMILVPTLREIIPAKYD